MNEPLSIQDVKPTECDGSPRGFWCWQRMGGMALVAGAIILYVAVTLGVVWIVH